MTVMALNGPFLARLNVELWYRSWQSREFRGWPQFNSSERSLLGERSSENASRELESSCRDKVKSIKVTQCCLAWWPATTDSPNCLVATSTCCYMYTSEITDSRPEPELVFFLILSAKSIRAATSFLEQFPWALSCGTQTFEFELKRPSKLAE